LAREVIGNLNWKKLGNLPPENLLGKVENPLFSPGIFFCE
jgi:hypothetical protein